MSSDFVRLIAAVQHVIHKYFIWIIVSSYVIAATFPAFGLLIRGAEFGSVEIVQTHINFSLPPMMLAFLLFNAGLGIRTSELTTLMRNPSALLAGAAGKFTRAARLRGRREHHDEALA